MALRITPACAVAALLLLPGCQAIEDFFASPTAEQKLETLGEIIADEVALATDDSPQGQALIAAGTSLAQLLANQNTTISDVLDKAEELIPLYEDYLRAKGKSEDKIAERATRIRNAIRAVRLAL